MQEFIENNARYIEKFAKKHPDHPNLQAMREYLEYGRAKLPPVPVQEDPIKRFSEEERNGLIGDGAKFWN